jgi:hypothetical protein
MSFLLFGCATIGTTDYIIPDYKEYTTGGIFVEKYWSYITGGKNVKLEGTFDNLTTRVVGGREELSFHVAVPEGLERVPVYARRDFAPQLYALKPGDRIVIYGKTQVITSRARVDGGFVGKQHAVELHKFERL